MRFDITSFETDTNLNGRNGLFRNDHSKKTISADNDFEAIEAFLHEYKDRPTTHRNYEKEAKRLHIWAILHLKKPLSSLTRDDFAEYCEFMGKPHKDWCGMKEAKESKNWRPFVGGLSESAIKTAIASLNSMFNWLCNAGYLSGNPLGLIRKKNSSTSDKKVERHLDGEMFSALLHKIESTPVNDKADQFKIERIRFILSAFILLGSRISELSTTKMRDFHKNPTGWYWEITGKGNKWAKVAMPPDMVEALMRWRKALGLSPTPRTSESIPAVPFVNNQCVPLFDKPGISPRRINQILKEHFEGAANDLERLGQIASADKLRQASAHWLRHTSISQKVNAGIDRAIVQKEARHADARTTNGYIHDDETKRSAEAEKHKLIWSN